MDNETLLRTYITEYERNVLNEEYDQEIKCYDSIKKVMYQMLIHYPVIMSKLLDNSCENENIDGIKTDETKAIKRLFTVVKSIDLEEIKELKKMICCLTKEIKFNLDNLSINEHRDIIVNNRMGILSTHIQPKYNYWLHYIESCSVHTNESCSAHTKIIKHINKEFKNSETKKLNSSKMDELNFFINYEDIFELFSGSENTLNIHIAESERQKILKKDTGKLFSELINKKITNEKMALNFMYEYNGHYLCQNKSHSKENTIKLSHLRMIPKKYPKNIKKEQNIMFKKISESEIQRLKMLNNLTKRINDTTTRNILLMGTTKEYILPCYFDKRDVDNYQKICNKKNILINDLQSVMDCDDVFDLTQDFGDNIWIIEELFELNIMLLLQ